MKDFQLYQRLLGIERPWRAREVILRKDGEGLPGCGGWRRCVQAETGVEYVVKRMAAAAANASAMPFTSIRVDSTSARKLCHAARNAEVPVLMGIQAVR